MNKLILGILPVIFILIFSPAYGEHIQDLRQGTAICNGELKDKDGDGIPDTKTIDCPPQASAFLEWCIEYQDGTECGESQRALTQFTKIPFTFFDEKKLRTLIRAEVSPMTDFSKMPEIYCIAEPSWTSKQTLTINGQTYDISRHLNIGDSFDQQTQIHTGTPLQFTPDLVERLLLEQAGVTLKSGDEFTWTTHFSNSAFVVEGTLTNPPVSSCDELDDIHNIAVGYDYYTVGLSSQMKFVWYDPLELITGDNDPSGLDIDNDGIPDSQDLCDFSPEVYNGFQDTDGCPDETNTNDSTFADSDGDGIVDSKDLCDLEPETFNGFEDTDGCPDVNVITPPPELFPSTESDPEFVSETPTENVHVEVGFEEPEVDNGVTDYCNNSEIENCEEIVQEAIRNTQSAGTGIKLPFQPNIFNLLILFGAISAVAIIIVRTRKK